MARLEPGSTIGIFGGGQLGRMLAVSAAELGLKTHIFSDVAGPALDVASAHTVQPYTDAGAVAAFAKAVDVVTYEFENVPLAAIDAAAVHAPVAPGRKALEVAQDRLVEKTFISELGISVAPFANVESEADFEPVVQTTGLPALLKTRRFGYDGKGQRRITTKQDLSAAFDELGREACILEGFVAFTKEVSVIAVRDRNGATVFYDLPENTHKNGILDTSVVPTDLSEATVAAAQTIAKQIADALDYVGVLAVELFVSKDGDGSSLRVNEIAPRVHNSGHWTQDACHISQFANHVRAIAGWPLGATDRHSDVTMTNLIGADVEAWPKLAAQAGAAIHLYGKGDCRPGRKMGHVNTLRALSPADPPDP